MHDGDHETFGWEMTLIYHYTTAEAFMNIVQEASLRFTDYRFLSDETEFNYGMTIVYNCLRDLASNDGDAAHFERQMQRFILETNRNNPFVCCFSRKRDDLNQWRAYSIGVSRVALAFDQELCSSMLLGTSGSMGEIIYDQGAQLHICGSVAAECYLQYREFMSRYDGLSDRDGRQFNDQMLQLAASLAMTAARMKHSSFEEEQEFRIVCDPSPMDPILTRIGPFGITP